jgi:hypothetical protein
MAQVKTKPKIENDKEKKLRADWSYAQSLQITLGVIEEYGVFSEDDVTFVVISPKGKRFTSKPTKVEASWKYVIFPDDFDPAVYSEQGIFSWQAVVKNKPVVKGKFEYKQFRMRIPSTITNKFE